MIIIIGILAAIAVPIYNNQVRLARLAANREHAKSAETLGIAAFLSSSGEVNPTAKRYGRNTVTYTYFIDAGTGVLNFCTNWGSDGSGGGSCGTGGADDRWIADGHHQVSTLTNVGSWTVNTTISDGIKLGDKIAKNLDGAFRPEDRRDRRILLRISEFERPDVPEGVAGRARWDRAEAILVQLMSGGA